MNRQDLPRRTVLKACAGVLAMSGLPWMTSGMAGWLGLERRPGLFSLSAASLESLRGDEFEAVDPSGTRSRLRLVKVVDRSHLTRREGIQQVSLILHTRPDADAPAGMYTIRHPEIATSHVLVTPRAKQGRGQHFEVVLSRHV